MLLVCVFCNEASQKSFGAWDCDCCRRWGQPLRVLSSQKARWSIHVDGYNLSMEGDDQACQIIFRNSSYSFNMSLLEFRKISNQELEDFAKQGEKVLMLPIYTHA